MYHKCRENSSHLRQLLLSVLTLVKNHGKSISSNLITISRFTKGYDRDYRCQRPFPSWQKPSCCRSAFGRRFCPFGYSIYRHNGQNRHRKRVSAILCRCRIYSTNGTQRTPAIRCAR